MAGVPTGRGDLFRSGLDVATLMGDNYVDHVIVYRDKAEQWRWRAVAGNGEVVSEGEAHTRAEDAARAARGVLGEQIDIRLEPLAPVEVTDGSA